MQKELSKSTQAYGKAKASERLAETQYNKAVKYQRIGRIRQSQLLLREIRNLPKRLSLRK